MKKVKMCIQTEHEENNTDEEDHKRNHASILINRWSNKVQQIFKGKKKKKYQENNF